jgi:hypothetical protein
MAKVVSLLPEFLDQSDPDPDPEPQPNVNGGPTTFNAVIVSGAGTTTSNGIYTEDGEETGKKKYTAESGNFIRWAGSGWELFDFAEDETLYETTQVDTENPWDATWQISNGAPPAPTLTPTNV